MEAWVSRGDIAARNELVEHNLRLVAHIVKKYYAHAADQEDLISIGTIGLIKGVSTYRPDKKVRLATYASRCIENEILMYFRAQRKSAGDLSLSDSIESDGEGNSLSLIDVLVDGEFIEDRKNISLSFRGSENQRIIDMNRTRAAGHIVLWEGMNGWK